MHLVLSEPYNTEKPIYIDFFTVESGERTQYYNTLSALYHRYKEHGLQIYTVVESKRMNYAKAALFRFEIEWPLVDSEIFWDRGQVSLVNLCIVQGNVVFQNINLRDLRRAVAPLFDK